MLLARPGWRKVPRGCLTRLLPPTAAKLIFSELRFQRFC